MPSVWKIPHVHQSWCRWVPFPLKTCLGNCALLLLTAYWPRLRDVVNCNNSKKIHPSFFPPFSLVPSFTPPLWFSLEPGSLSFIPSPRNVVFLINGFGLVYFSGDRLSFSAPHFLPEEWISGETNCCVPWYMHRKKIHGNLVIAFVSQTRHK